MINKLGLSISLVWVFPLLVFGQPIRYSNHYDLNGGAGGLLDVVILGNGNLQAVGSSLNLSNNFGRDDGFYVQESDDGQPISQHGISLLDRSVNIRAVIKSPSGSVYSSGYFCDFRFESPSYCDFLFQKLDNEGDTIFSRVYPRVDTCDYLLDMVQTRPNKIMLVGWTCNDTTQDNTELMFITVDTLGNEVNRVVYGGGATDFISAGVVVDSLGDIIMAGYTRSFPSASSGRTWVIRTDSIGNVKWQKTYSGVSGITSSAARITMIPDGSLLVAGGNSGFGNSAFGGDGSLMKLDTAGNMLWAKEYQVMGGQGLWGVVGLEDGTIVSCGVTDGPSDSQAGWLIKTDANGDTLWTRTFDESDGTDYLRNMLVMDNGDIVMVGFGRGTNSTSQDGWILRVDSMGCVVENCFTVGIEESSTNENGFIVYPNPVNDFLNIALKQGHINRVDLYNAFGALVYSETGTAQQKRIDVSGLNGGVYLMLVETDRGVSSTKLMLE
jgi:hypothetical protein